jgi:hypothetical protein
MPSNFTITPAWQHEKTKGGMRFAFPAYGGLFTYNFKGNLSIIALLSGRNYLR